MHNASVSYNPIIPAPIVAKLEALEALCTKYETKIPVNEVAGFLGIKTECLRFHIENGRVPFAIGGDVNTMERHFVIPTTAFYFWYIQGTRFSPL